MLEIRTFGTVSFRDLVTGSDRGAILSRPKRAALLIYLATARPHGFRRRDELFAVFWPDRPQRMARKALNQSVYVLRSLLGQALIVGRGGEDIGLDRSLVSCDAVAFEQALDRDDRRAALELYRGEFLAAFHTMGSKAFERWMDVERDRYVRRALEAAVAQADAEKAAGDIGKAAGWIRWALEQSPYDEALLERLLRFLADQGDETAARRELERFAGRLETDLGLEISAEIRALASQVPRHGTIRDARKEEAPAAGGTIEAPEGTTARTVDGPGTARGRLARRVAGVVAVASLVGVALFTANRTGGSTASPPKLRRIIVSPLENLTGLSSLEPLGRIAADWVAQGLLRTGLVGVVPISANPQADLAAMAADAGMDLAFSGAYHRDGDRLVLEAWIIDVDSRTVVRSLDPIDATDKDPLAGLERLRQHATGALATLVDPRFADWADDASQPPSLEAYLQYVDGMVWLERGDYQGAGERFLAAAARDSSFTSAYLWAIQSYALVGEGPSDSLALALEPKQDRLPPWDRAMLDFHLAHLRYDNLGAYQAMRRVVRLSPTPQWRILLAEQARGINRPAETLELVTGIEPDQVTGIPISLYWLVLGNALHGTGRFEEQLAHAKRWEVESPGAAQLQEFSALAGLGRGDEVVRRVLEVSREWSWTYERAELLRRVALELRAHGQKEEARAVLERSFELYEAAGDSLRRDPESRLVIGRSLYAADRWEESRALFERLLGEGHRPVVVRGDIGIAAARLGDRESAESLIDWYTRWARDNPGHGGWATQWRARIAAALGDRDAAVRWLRQAHEEGWPFMIWDHRTEEYENLRGYAAFEEMMRPQGRDSEWG